MISVTNYEKHLHDSQHFKTSFSLRNVPVYVANSMRRAMSSMVPTITFDDTYYEDNSLMSIKIRKNTSALHDQFLSHRISHVPINMENQDYFNIETILDEDTSERVFGFNKLSKDIQFKLKKKNNNIQNEFRDKQGLIDVTTEDFSVIDTSSSTKIDNRMFFKPDIFTNDYILLNKLKQDLSNEEGGEELDIECVPKIGMGRFNAKNDPTGTVTYQMEQDSVSAVDAVFKHKKEHLNRERNKKGLENFTEEEENQFRKSFDLLDRDRVIKTDENGNPNSFLFSVESIGFMNPDSIIIDSLGVLILSLKDIQNSFTFYPDKYGFYTSNKLTVSELDQSNVNVGIDIKVKNENHTIGNMLSNIVRNMWCSMGTDLELPVFKMVSYKMDHPTIEDIDFILIPEDIPKETMIEYIRRLYASDRSLNKISKDEFDKLSTKSHEFIVELLSVLLFQKSISKCINLLLDIKVKFCSEMSVDSDTAVTFMIKDGDDYMSKNIELIASLDKDLSLTDYPYLNNLCDILGRKAETPKSPEYQAMSPVAEAETPKSPEYPAMSPVAEAETPKSPEYPAMSPMADVSDKSEKSDTEVKQQPKYKIAIPKWLQSIITDIDPDDYHRIMRFLSKDYTNDTGKDTVEIVLNEKTITKDGQETGKITRQVIVLDYVNKTSKRVNRTIKINKS